MCLVEASSLVCLMKDTSTPTDRIFQEVLSLISGYYDTKERSIALTRCDDLK